jgi:hypothetical protein
MRGWLTQVLLIGIEIDADGCEVRSRNPDEDAVDRVHDHEPVASVLMDQHVSRSGVPTSVGSDSHRGIGLDVLDVLRPRSVSDDEPERVPTQTTANRGLSRPTGPSPARLHDRPSRHHASERTVQGHERALIRNHPAQRCQTFEQRWPDNEDNDAGDRRDDDLASHRPGIITVAAQQSPRRP